MVSIDSSLEICSSKLELERGQLTLSSIKARCSIISLFLIDQSTFHTEEMFLSMVLDFYGFKVYEFYFFWAGGLGVENI